MSDDSSDEKERPLVAKTAVDLQRLKLMKLMKNPDKPVIIPERPKVKGTQSVPEFVRNVMGSSAGAGSGEFHVYRHLRRKEYSRQKQIQEKSHKELLNEEYHKKLEENKKLAEELTAKKRAKRFKKKQKMKNKKFKPNQNRNNQENSSDSDSENSEDEKHNNLTEVSEKKEKTDSEVNRDVDMVPADEPKKSREEKNVSNNSDEEELNNVAENSEDNKKVHKTKSKTNTAANMALDEPIVTSEEKDIQSEVQAPKVETDYDIPVINVAEEKSRENLGEKTCEVKYDDATREDTKNTSVTEVYNKKSETMIEAKDCVVEKTNETNNTDSKESKGDQNAE